MLEIMEFSPENRYLKKGRLLKQSSGDVYRAEDRMLKKKVLMKIFKRSGHMDNRIIGREIAISKMFKHPNILCITDYHISEKLSYYVTDFPMEETLADYMKANPITPEAKVLKFIKRIYSGLSYLHSFNVFHANLCPESILLVDTKRMGPHFKLLLSDFCLANVTLQGSWNLEVCGPLYYSSPEILKEENINCSTDLFSLGIIMYEMLYGVSPFPKLPRDKYIQHLLKNKKIKFPSSPEVSGETKDLLASLLQTDRRRRISLQKLNCHPYFSAVLFNEVPVEEVLNTAAQSIARVLSEGRDSKHANAFAALSEALLWLRIKLENCNSFANEHMEVTLDHYIVAYALIEKLAVNNGETVNGLGASGIRPTKNNKAWDQVLYLADNSDNKLESIQKGTIGRALCRAGNAEGVELLHSASKTLIQLMKKETDPTKREVLEQYVRENMNVLKNFEERPE